jgi:putative hemolysin
MEQGVGGAMEALCGRRETSGKRLSGPLFKSFLLKRLLPLKRVNNVLSNFVSLPDEASVADRVLEALDVAYEVSASDRAKVPLQGPLVVVANHPFGAIEGMVLASILLKARSDTKIMANFLLSALGVDELDKLMIFVDPFERKDSLKKNLKPLREAIEWVRHGRALGIFPAGEVSHVHLSNMSVVDKEWSPTVARIVRKTQATVLPVYFEGRNSRLFCGLGLLHPMIRTLMLAGENTKKGPRTVRAHIGRPIPFKRLVGLDDLEIMDYLRLRTYNLQNRGREKQRKPILRRLFKSTENQRPIVSPGNAGLMADEIRGLPREQFLFSSKNYDVVCASAAQIPAALREIGRLRELTFRKAGEGTGNPIDIDRFDEFYQHIILWDREGGEIIGAYRLGASDLILGERGLRGLYTNTLFEYKDELFHRIRWSLEVGRSFVVPEHQKTYQPLMLLWSGIGRFVIRYPKYRFLFGAVSINNEYMGISRKLILEFLKEGHIHADLARFVQARNAPPVKSIGKKNLGLAYSMVHDVQDFSELISDIEKDEAGIPILLKHYMKLGGKFIGFSVDPKFNNTLDALVLVDLVRTDPRILARYMGQQGMESFLQYNGVKSGGSSRSNLSDDKCA